MQGPEPTLQDDVKELEAQGYACVVRDLIDTATIGRDGSRGLAREVYDQKIRDLIDSGF